MLVVIAVVLLGTAIVWWARRDRRRAEPLPAIFRVLTLGSSGSGKTVFLAGMFHELYVPRPGKRSYYLESDVHTTNFLSGIHRQVVDSAAEWPTGTAVGDSRHFLFTCVNVNGNERHHVLQINYLDYAGELLEHRHQLDPIAADARRDKLEELEREANNAHAILAILDGRKLAQFLRGKESGKLYMRNTINPMVAMLVRSTCPIHFLVTKWDLVRCIGEDQQDSDDARLARVRSALHDHADLGELIRSAGPGGRTIRLIPLSVTGPDFTKVGNDGQIMKVDGAEPVSMNLDVPLSAIVPDYFDQLDAQIAAVDREKIRRTNGPAAKTRRSLSAAAGAAINAGLRSTVGPRAADAATELFFDFIAGQSSTARTAEAFDLDFQRRKARTRVLDDFKKRLWEAERDLPASRLDRP